MFADVRHDAIEEIRGVAADAFAVADIGFTDSPSDGPHGVAADAFSGG